MGARRVDRSSHRHGVELSTWPSGARCLPGRGMWLCRTVDGWRVERCPPRRWVPAASMGACRVDRCSHRRGVELSTWRDGAWSHRPGGAGLAVRGPAAGSVGTAARGHQREDTSAGTPARGHQREDTSARTPARGHQHEDTSARTQRGNPSAETPAREPRRGTPSAGTPAREPQRGNSTAAAAALAEASGVGAHPRVAAGTQRDGNRYRQRSLRTDPPLHNVIDASVGNHAKER